MSDELEDSRTSTHDVLLEAALRVIARDGFRGATARAVTKEAGVSLALIRYHFGTQDKLLQMAVERAGTQLFEAAEDLALAEDLADLMRRGVAFVEQVEHDPNVRVLFEATLNAQYSAWMKAWSSEQIDAFRELIAAKAPPHLTPAERRALGYTLAAFLDGAFLHLWVDSSVDVQAMLDGALVLVNAVAQTGDG